MERKDIKKAVFEVIEEYGKVLESTTRGTYGAPESLLPYSKEVIKKAIKVALVIGDDKDTIDFLKTNYISLANFVPDGEAKRAEEIPNHIFSFLELTEDKKKEFLRERFKSGLLGDYEMAVKITRKIAGEQKRLKEELDEFLKKIEVE